MNMLKRPAILIQNAVPRPPPHNSFRVKRPAGRAGRLPVASERATSSSSSSAHGVPAEPPPPSILLAPLRWYVSKLDTHPLATKCLSSGLISASGDLLCQHLCSKKETHDDDDGDERREDEPNESSRSDHREFDRARTARFAVLGCFFVAPTVHVWYGLLMSRIPGAGVSAVARRLFCDQGLFAPLFTPTFVSCLTMLEHVWPGGGIGDDEGGESDDASLSSRIATRLRNDVPEALVVGWSMWIPSMAFMFAFVPGKFQVLFSNCVGFVWNAYLSWRTHEAEEEGVSSPSKGTWNTFSKDKSK